MSATHLPEAPEDELNRLRKAVHESRQTTSLKPVADGMEVSARKLLPLADISTPAQNAEADLTEVRNAAKSRFDADLMHPTDRPRYMRRMIWSFKESIPVNADSSVVRAILPNVPDVVRHDPVINRTLQRRPDLFPIVTPIDVDHLYGLLWRHPNQPYVESVCRALREGFWPWADPTCGEYPSTHDEQLSSPLDDRALQFLRDQRDEEITRGRFSQSFGRHLLPGMYSMPVHAVPKPNTDKLRLVTNHSAGPFALNSMITKQAIAGVVMDGVPAIGYALREFRRKHGRSVQLVMWKSDVSQAYRLIPMSPFWQIKQIVTIDGERHVDHNNVFGGRGSERAFDSVNTLVNWLAKHERGISNLMNYVDDNFAFDLAGNTVFYAPYGKHMPERQVQLLLLWDELGIPHEERKQLSGHVLTIIGFEIDPNKMAASLPAESKDKLLHHVRSFCDSPKGGRRRSLKEFQSLTGYLNWVFNVSPLLKPGLSNVYAKIAGKTNPHAGIHLNKAITDDLRWLASHVENAQGVCFLDAEPWGLDELDWADPLCEIAYTDASAQGIGLWFPWLKQAYFCDLPGDPPADTIFFFEALAVCCAMHCIVQWRRDTGCLQLRRFGVYSDNSNSVNIFDSLRAKPAYNSILRSAVDLCISESFQFRVQHIPGKDNVIADALSRRQFDLVQELVPDVNITTFQPPRDALGAIKK
ncbi:hypothetical protein EVJ58_g9702 [Rhodofomes roseus]|uniref:Reverse transcriptase n=1 Tax=Rhodofomes roseus TaxID=34475 RepID=A0A4Y9XT93_9APHY|nr:hypothetical protein EVJ58_g9702 [Rhodofomes roseus]